jgi:hypothetical protein
MFDDKNEGYHHHHRITFTFRENFNGVTTDVERSLDNKLTYSEIVDEFVWFLQNMGYTYIGGLVVLDDKGNELYNTIR